MMTSDKKRDPTPSLEKALFSSGGGDKQSNKGFSWRKLQSPYTKSEEKSKGEFESIKKRLLQTGEKSGITPVKSPLRTEPDSDNAILSAYKTAVATHRRRSLCGSEILPKRVATFFAPTNYSEGTQADNPGSARIKALNLDLLRKMDEVSHFTVPPTITHRSIEIQTDRVQQTVFVPQQDKLAKTQRISQRRYKRAGVTRRKVSVPLPPFKEKRGEVLQLMDDIEDLKKRLLEQTREDTSAETLKSNVTKLVERLANNSRMILGLHNEILADEVLARHKGEVVDQLAGEIETLTVPIFRGLTYSTETIGKGKRDTETD